jgi:hypothetical protein
MPDTEDRSVVVLAFVSSGDLVTIVVPAQPEYLRLARLASADAGSRAGFGYEEIDDLRLAVSELCHLLLGDGARETMTLEFATDPGRVVVNGHATKPGMAIDDGLAQTILAQVTDEYTIADSPDGRRFRVTKIHRDFDAPGDDSLTSESSATRTV